MTESIREDTAARPGVWLSGRIGISFFNNLEEAKRIESQLRGFDAGL
jgi:hypothetical protein